MSGRLSQDEHADRLEQTLQARTLGELEPITRDLARTRSGRAAAGRGAVASNSLVPIEEPANPADSFDTMIGDLRRWRAEAAAGGSSAGPTRSRCSAATTWT